MDPFPSSISTCIITRAPTIGLPPFRTCAKIVRGWNSSAFEVELASSMPTATVRFNVVSDVQVETVIKLDSIWLLGFDVTVTMFFRLTTSRFGASTSLATSRGWCHSMVYCHVTPICCGCDKMKDNERVLRYHLFKRSARLVRQQKIFERQYDFEPRKHLS